MPFETEQELLEFYKDNPATIWAGIVFTQDGNSNQWNYKLRINGTYAPTTNPDQQVSYYGREFFICYRCLDFRVKKKKTWAWNLSD